MFSSNYHCRPLGSSTKRPRSKLLQFPVLTLGGALLGVLSIECVSISLGSNTHNMRARPKLTKLIR